MSMRHSTKPLESLANRNIELGRVSYQAWRKNVHFVSPSYRAKAFWGLSGLGCIIFLWSVLQAFLAADITALDRLQKLSFNYSMVFTIFVGLVLAGLCLVICFQGVSLRLVNGDDDLEEGGGWLELRQSFKKPRQFPLNTYRFARIISNETSQDLSNLSNRQNYPHALKNNSHTLLLSFKNAAITLESQDLNGLEALKKHLDEEA